MLADKSNNKSDPKNSTENSNTDEGSSTAVEFQTKIMNLILERDLDQLRKMKLHQRNLNFLIDFPEVDIDSKISPLILASFLGSADVIKILLQNPLLDIDLESDETRFTPLAVACLAGNFEVVSLLLENEPEVNKPTALNQTPLSLCFNRLNEETNTLENKIICFKMASLLLDSGADINWIVDKNKGLTMLMQYCSIKQEMSEREKEANADVIRFLLQHGASKSLTSMKNKTCFDLAQKSSNKEAVLELLNQTQQIYFHKKRRPLRPIQNLPEKPMKNTDGLENCCSILPFLHKLNARSNRG